MMLSAGGITGHKTVCYSALLELDSDNRQVTPVSGKCLKDSEADDGLESWVQEVFS